MSGAVGMQAFLHSRMPLSDVRTIDQARQVPISELAKQLKLTPDQKKAVMFQLDEYGKYYQNIEEERADVARLGIQAIMSCLNEDQRKLFAHKFGVKR